MGTFTGSASVGGLIFFLEKYPSFIQALLPLGIAQSKFILKHSDDRVNVPIACLAVGTIHTVGDAEHSIAETAVCSPIFKPVNIFHCGRKTC
jgi:hypothetical protein